MFPMQGQGQMMPMRFGAKQTMLAPQGSIRNQSQQMPEDWWQQKGNYFYAPHPANLRFGYGGGNFGGYTAGYGGPL